MGDGTEQGKGGSRCDKVTRLASLLREIARASGQPMTQKRALALARSIDATPEQLAAQSLRRAYIERFGSEKVAWAARRATDHKARSAKRGCTEHFTAWQLLDLCEVHGFRCSWCNQETKPLYLHHRIGLYQDGPNTIDNIEPLCDDCHGQLEGCPDDVSERWMLLQDRLLLKFPVGTRVRLFAKRPGWATPDANEWIPKTWIGEVLELIPPERGARPLRGWLTAEGKLRYAQFDSPWYSGSSLFQDWQLLGARARVRWQKRARGSQKGWAEAGERVVCLRGIEAAPTLRRPSDS